MPTGALLGRDDALVEVEARTRRHRLVTIVGPGGVGKTALARAVAAHLGHEYPMGVGEVDLARIDDDDAVRGALASQLGFESFDALLSSPSDRPMLLLVDNCEHVVDACASAVAEILGACRQPVVLATSRVPLELPGESIVTLAPLAVPSSAVDAANSSSVQLFIERVRDAGGDVSDGDLATIAELCRRLDGLPLAIEIAAARTRTMSVGEICDRLTAAIDVLERPRFRGDRRHRSIAETIRWSHELLAPGPARLLPQLGVFTGPFTAEQGRAVADPGSNFDVDLEELVNASLVVIDTRTSPTNYRLLETIRRYGRDDLRRRGDLEVVFDRFVDHVTGTVIRTIEGSAGTWRPSLVRELVDQYDDIAEALAHAVAHDATPERAYRLCGTLWAIVHQAHADDIVVLCRRTLQRWPADDSTAAARTIAALATAEYVTGHPDVAAEVADAALDAARRTTDATITLHRALGQARRALGDLPGAEATFRTGASIGHELNMTAMALELDVAAAIVAADQGNVEQGIAETQLALERSEAAGSAVSASWARTSLGWLLLRRDASEAMRVIEAALDEARAIDYPVAIAVGLRSLAYAHLLAGRDDDAADTIAALVEELVRRGALTNLRLLADVTAAAAHRRGHPAWARFAATARSLPITTQTAAQFELIELPTVDAVPYPRHELVGVARHVLAELRSSVDGTTMHTEGSLGSPQPADVNVVRRLGEMYELTFAGRTIAVRGTKGLADIVRLVGAAGNEVHCLDLAGVAVEQASTGEAIDATARRQYEQRIRDLQVEIDEAEANSDYERAYRHQEELDQLIDHLSAAVGLGGRARRASSGSAERARSAVTHRVRTTIRQISRLHPQLGAHLEHSVNTGTYCSYRPERPTPWTVF